MQEILEGENAWYNEKTKQKVNIKKQIRFFSFQNILVIDFKRFNYRNQKNYVRRNRELVMKMITTVDNYDYSINWIFRQDGTLEVDFTEKSLEVE